MVRNTFPQYYILEIHGRSLNYSEQVVYVNNEASCEGVTLPCNQFSVEDDIVHLPFNMSQVLAKRSSACQVMSWFCGFYGVPPLCLY